MFKCLKLLKPVLAGVDSSLPFPVLPMNRLAQSNRAFNIFSFAVLYFLIFSSRVRYMVVTVGFLINKEGRHSTNAPTTQYHRHSSAGHHTGQGKKAKEGEAVRNKEEVKVCLYFVSLD
jgi:hypothetical protein